MRCARLWHFRKCHTELWAARRQTVARIRRLSLESGGAFGAARGDEVGRKGEKAGETGVEGEAGGYADPSESEANQIEDGAEIILARNALCGGKIRVGGEQMMTARHGITPEQIEDDGDEDIGGIEKHGGGALTRLAEIGGENSGGKWDGSDAEEEEEIENQEHVVGALDVIVEAVVIDPHDADECETDQEGKVKGPIGQELARKRAAGRRRNLDVEDQQRDGDGEDAVGEGFDARGFRGQWRPPVCERESN